MFDLFQFSYLKRECNCVSDHEVFDFLFLRLAHSIESMQRFSLSADPSFRHFQLDVSRELKLLADLNFIQGRKNIKDEHSDIHSLTNGG